MASLLPQPKQLFQDNAWNPLVGGQIFTYAAGTLTPKATFQDAALTIANNNPIVVNARGEALMFGDGAYRIIAKDSSGNTLYDVDNIESASSLVNAALSGLTSSSGAATIGYQPATGVATNVQARLRAIDASRSIMVRDQPFNPVCDGVADDTAAVRAAHEAANVAGRSVSYAGIQKIAIQANALIPVKTSVDWAGCEVVILGGVNATPSFSTFNTAYIVTDDASPLTTVTGAVTSSNLAEGSLFPTLGLFDGHGYAKVTAGLQVPNRDKTATMNYTQSFKVNRNGRVSHALSTDLTAHAASITVAYRKTSLKRIKLENINLTEGDWNNQRVLRIERCNVEVDNFTMLFAATSNTNNIHELISIADASDIRISNFVTTGRQNSPNKASYCLAINGGADIYVDRMNALTGWGATGCNDLNGVHFTSCVLNRIDCHSSAHNVFADDCDIHENGMVYGWGGGILSVKNSRAYRCTVIATRQDYGGTFFGSIIADNVECSNNFTSTYIAVDLATNALGASVTVKAPKSIDVSNIRRVGVASASNAEFVPIAIKILDAASVVNAPARISVSNASCAFPAWRFGLRVDTLNMEAHSTSFPITKILVSNVYPDASASGASSSLTTGILEYDSVRTPTTAVRPQIIVTSGDNIAIRARNAANLDIRVKDAGLNAIQVDTASATQPAVVVDCCRMFVPAAGFATAPIGGTTSGSSGYTIVRDCEIGAALFDLSLVAALQGNTIRTGANTPTLPSGVTANQAFTGYQKAGMFKS